MKKLKNIGNLFLNVINNAWSNIPQYFFILYLIFLRLKKENKYWRLDVVQV